MSKHKVAVWTQEATNNLRSVLVVDVQSTAILCICSNKGIKTYLALTVLLLEHPVKIVQREVVRLELTLQTLLVTHGCGASAHVGIVLVSLVRILKTCATSLVVSSKIARLANLAATFVELARKLGSLTDFTEAAIRALDGVRVLVQGWPFRSGLDGPHRGVPERHLS